jgi:hypothetical protein
MSAELSAARRAWIRAERAIWTASAGITVEALRELERAADEAWSTYQSVGGPMAHMSPVRDVA